MTDIDDLVEAGVDRAPKRDHLDQRYQLGRRVRRQVESAYEPKLGEPSIRRLRIFAIDPAASKLEGKTALAEVPYEPLEAGPIGRLLEVDNSNGATAEVYSPACLDDTSTVLSHGYAPSESDHRFHAQMVYSVASLVHAKFRRSLGRQVGWAFGSDDVAGVPRRLRLRPFAGEQRNAWYDPNEGALNFGYFEADQRPTDRTLPKGIVFTSLSHDIIAHEMSHAMLDALRENYKVPSSNDMTGFHEGFSDLVALFHHFFHRDALRVAIAKSRGDLRSPEYLSRIGQQFQRSAGGAEALRNAADDATRYDPAHEPHKMGALLIAAVYEAFTVVFKRKTKRYWRLASGGTGQIPEGDLPDLLVDVLAIKAAELADQFLSMLIRAVDYLPPVDVRLGEYLRAIITADSDLVQDDPWGYREALIDAFRRREIYPRDVASLNEDSLLWKGPATIEPIDDLSFREIWFQGDPGLPVSVGEQIAQACALGEFVTESQERMREFGLVATGDPLLEGDAVELPVVESVRTLSRPGPDGRIVFDTVAEIIQVRRVRQRNSKPGFDIWGGSTVILNSSGVPRLLILKSVVGDRRLDRRLDFLASESGARFWKLKGKRYVEKTGTPFLAMCERS